MGHGNRGRGHRPHNEPEQREEDCADDGAFPPQGHPEPVGRLLAQFFEEVCAADDAQRPDINGNGEQEQQSDAGALSDVRFQSHRNDGDGKHRDRTGEEHQKGQP